MRLLKAMRETALGWITRDTAELVLRYDSLTPREREVMKWVVSGRLNKQIGADLGISEITVKVHRGR